MKYLIKPLSILLVLPVLFFACSKVDNVDKRPFTYSLEGFRNISIPSNYETGFSLEAKLTSGDPRDKFFTISMEGLPDSIVADSSSISFRLNYSPFFHLHAQNAIQGIYPIRLVTRLNSEIVRTDNINLTVEPPVSLIKWLCKRYYYDVSTSCGGGIYAKIDSLPSVLNRINISIEDLMNMGQLPDDFIDTYADVNARDSTFVIPLQEVRGDSIKGKGHYYVVNGYRLKMHIDDTLIAGGHVTNTCSIEMSYNN